MSEGKFEEFLHREAQAYNTPPATAPRDEMWAAIAQARSTAPRAGAACAADGTTAGDTTSMRRRARYAPWLGMAATLLIGVGIGRFAMERGPASLLRQDSTVAVDATSTAIDEGPADVGGALAAAGTDRGPEAGTEVGPARARDVEQSSVGAREVARSRVGAREVAQLPVGARDVAALPAGARGASAGSSRASTELSPTYEVASQRHLVRAEALVAVVAAAPRDPMMDSLTSLWARDVLSNTRLMLDSPVGDDPIRRRLLEDLETLLVQLVQRSGPAGEERALIDRTLQRTQLLTRLRTSASGT